MIRAGRPGVEDGECRGQVARSLARLRADRREGVRVLLLRHESARAAVRIGELHEPELLARVDLEVLADLALMRGSDRERREQLDVDVGLPRRILGVLDQPVAAEQARRARCGRAPSASRRCHRRRRRSPRGPHAMPARARRLAAPGRRRRGADARRSSAGQAAGRCNRSRGRLVWRARVAREPPAWAVRASCSSRAAVRAVRRRPTRKASRRGRPALSHPAAERPTRRSSSASRALKASPRDGSHGNSSPGIACSSSNPRTSARASSPSRSPPSISATACARSASERPRARRGPCALSAA